MGQKSFQTDSKSSDLIDLNSILGSSGGVIIDQTSMTEAGSAQYSFEDTTSLLPIESATQGISDTEVSDLIVKSKSTTAQRIIRIHYSDKIIRNLEWIAENHVPNSINSTMHITLFFGNLLSLFKNNSEDPFSSYIIALYDGLSYKDFWLTLGREKYKKLLKQFKNLVNRDISDYRLIDKEINKLESIGINTTPY